MKVPNSINILWLIALILFTPTTGLLLNPDIFSARSVLLLLIWSVVLLTPYVLTSRKGLYIAAASLIFADGFVNLFHWVIVKCPLNASPIFVFLNTNTEEASEFMTIKATPLLLLLIPYTALFILALTHIPPLSFKSKRERCVWIVLWLFTGIFFADNVIHRRFLRLAVPEVERAVVSFINEREEYSNLKHRELYTLDAKLINADSTHAVVIRCESCNLNHISVY